MTSFNPKNNLSPASFFVTCASGFETALCEELQEIFEIYNVEAHVSVGSAGCMVDGPFECCLLLNLTSFCASRILYVALECEVENEEELTEKIGEINWPSLFDVNKSFCVKSNVTQAFVQNSMYLSLKVKDALCDKFVEVQQKRPNVETKNPDVTIYVRLVRNSLSVTLDTSGQPLFMRGYKQNSHEAPLKETLASSLLRLSGWNKVVHSIFNSNEPVYFERVAEEPKATEQKRRIPKQVLLSPFLQDQFCGSGTIVIEAALALLQYNPNCKREKFAFVNLFPENQTEIAEEFERLKTIVLSRVRKISDVKNKIKEYAQHNKIEFKNSDGEEFFPLLGSDISENSIHSAKEFAKKAGVSELISFSCADVQTVVPHASCGIILINPPYGERIGNKINLPLLYKSIGTQWKTQFPHWSAWILSSNESLTQSVGLRATRKFSVYNGNLECRFLQYVMYPLSSSSPVLP